jgi:hypothetical protein
VDTGALENEFLAQILDLPNPSAMAKSSQIQFILVTITPAHGLASDEGSNQGLKDGMQTGKMLVQNQSTRLSGRMECRNGKQKLIPPFSTSNLVN